jgi:hypothetical protein
VIGSASASYRAARDPETRMKMAHEIIREHKWEGYAQPYDPEMQALVRERASQMAVGTKAEREKLSELQKQRKEIEGQVKAEDKEGEAARKQRQQLMGLAGVPFKAVAGMVGLVGIGAAIAEGIRGAEEMERVNLRLEKITGNVALNIAAWSKGTAMYGREAALYTEQMSRIFGATNRGTDIGRLGLAVMGLDPKEMFAYAPMFRAAGATNLESMYAIMNQARNAAMRGGNPADRAGLLGGAAMATEVLGRTVINPNMGGALTSLSLIQSMMGGQMSPDRAARVMMSINQSMQADDPTHRSFMLRALGYSGGSLASYQDTVMKIEKGVSDPQNVRSMLERARMETGSREQMIQLMTGMGLSMTQSSQLVGKYLGGGMSDEEIKAMTKGGGKTREQIESEMNENMTAVQAALKAVKTALIDTGKIILEKMVPLLEVIAKYLPQFANVILHPKDTLKEILGLDTKSKEMEQRAQERYRDYIKEHKRGASWAGPSMQEIEGVLEVGTEKTETQLLKKARGAAAGQLPESRYANVIYQSGKNTYVLNIPKDSWYGAMQEMEKITQATKKEAEGEITQEEMGELYRTGAFLQKLK